MSTGWNRLSAETLRHELEHGRDLLARHVELLHNLLDAEVFEVLDDSGHGQTGALEHPGTTHLAGDALDDRAPGPVKCCHGLNSSLKLTATRLTGHVGRLTPLAGAPQPAAPTRQPG